MPLIPLPVTWAPGNIITSNWGNSVGTNVALLDSRTGGDPLAASRLLIANGPTSALWRLLQAGDYQNGTIPSAAMIEQKVNQVSVDPNVNSFAGALPGSGFYRIAFPVVGDAPPVTPVPADWHLIQSRHPSWGVDYRVQLAFDISDVKNSYIRMIVNGGTIGWAKIWHSMNDGVNSGLDADLFNGLTYAQAKADIAASVPGASVEVPVGVIAMWRNANTPPSGWVIETTMRNLMPIGFDDSVPGFTGNPGIGALTQVGGTAGHTHLMASHQHGVAPHLHGMSGHVHSGPDHSHSGSPLSISGKTSGPSGQNTTGGTGNTSGDGSHTHDPGTMDIAGNTGQAGTGNTGGNSDNTGGPGQIDGSTPANTGVNNSPTAGPNNGYPPYQVVMFIRKV
jgi:hypothetical protein